MVWKVLVALVCGLWDMEAMWLSAWLRCCIGNDMGVVCGGGVKEDWVWVVVWEDVLLGGGEGKMTAEARFAL